jgi:hypothetical protein
MAKGESDWREEASARYKEKSQKGRFKLLEGENTLRILPRIGGKDSKTPFYEYMVHREVGPNKRFVRCGKNMHTEGKCWICDSKIPELQGSGNPAKEKRAASLEPKEQFCLQVAVVDTDTQKMRGPYLWTVPTGGSRSLAARILGVLKSTKRDYIDPDEGYNLTIERTGTGKTDTIYGQITPDEESSKLSGRIFGAGKSFESYVAPYSEEQQKAAYFGRDEQEAAPEDTEGEEASESEEDRPKKKPHAEEEDEPAPKKHRPAEEEEDEPAPKKKSPVVEEEDEPAPKKKRPVAEEEEEEEPKPKKKVYAEEEEERPKKKKPVEEDEGEPEAEPEEEEEKPKPKAKKVYAEEEEERPKKKRPAASEDD